MAVDSASEENAVVTNRPQQVRQLFRRYPVLARSRSKFRLPKAVADKVANALNIGIGIENAIIEEELKTDPNADILLEEFDLPDKPIYKYDDLISMILAVALYDSALDRFKQEAPDSTLELDLDLLVTPSGALEVARQLEALLTDEDFVQFIIEDVSSPEEEAPVEETPLEEEPIAPSPTMEPNEAEVTNDEEVVQP